MVEKKKKDKKEEVEGVDKRKSRGCYGDEFSFPTFGYFPKHLWDIYKKDAKENFGDSWWVKAWNDHLISKQKNKEDYMLQVILELKHEIEVLKMQYMKKDEKKEEEDESVSTFSGKVK